MIKTPRAQDRDKVVFALTENSYNGGSNLAVPISTNRACADA